MACNRCQLLLVFTYKLWIARAESHYVAAKEETVTYLFYLQENMELRFDYEQARKENPRLKVIGHFRITFSLFLKASLGAHLSYENVISFTCKLNSFSYEWLCTRPRFEREALGNSEIVY